MSREHCTNTENANKPRRSVAYVSTLGTTHLHLRNPYMVAFWSAMFPGLGHMLLSKYLRGFVLFGLEVLTNIEGHINLALFYSFTGNIEAAKSALDKRWMLLYIPTYFYTIWNSYRSTVDINNQYILAVRENAPVKPFTINGVDINYLDKKEPWSSAVWSFLMPGAGQLSIHRLITAFFILSWWIVMVYYSRLLPALHLTLMGDFKGGAAVLDEQWVLNIPSVLFFAIYDAYINTVEGNKLFEWEQKRHLNLNYQDRAFQMPGNIKAMPGAQNTDGSEPMYIVSAFEHSISLEKAVTAVEMLGVARKDILAVPLDKRGEEVRLFDSIHRSDGVSLLELPFVLGTFFTLIGGIYGFILAWGPIIWGLIGLVAGLAIGLAIRLPLMKKNMKNREKRIAAEVILIIKCDNSRVERVWNILWSHQALGVRKLDLDGEVIPGQDQ